MHEVEQARIRMDEYQNNTVGGASPAQTEAKPYARDSKGRVWEVADLLSHLHESEKLQVFEIIQKRQGEGAGLLHPGYGPQELSLNNIEDAMRYQPWNKDQQDRGEEVREVLTMAAKSILRNVPRSPLRTRALNDLIDCRMKANAAITFGGRF